MSHTLRKNPGLGTTLSYSVDNGVTWVAISQIVNLDGPEISVGTAELPGLSNTWKQSRPTLPDGGEISGQVYYDPADTSHTFLNTLITTTPQPVVSTTLWKLTFNDTQTSGGTASNFQFAGYLTKLKPGGIEEEGTLTADVTIKVTGAITITASGT